MTAALEGGEWSAARPGRTLPPGKTRYPLYRRLGGPQGRSGRAENLVPTGIRSRTVQPVVSRHTDWATRPTHAHITTINYGATGKWRKGIPPYLRTDTNFRGDRKYGQEIVHMYTYVPRVAGNTAKSCQSGTNISFFYTKGGKHVF